MGDITATSGGFKPLLVWSVDKWPWCANHLPSGKSSLLSRSYFIVSSDYTSRVHEGHNPMLLVMCEHSLWITFQNKVWKGYLGKVQSYSQSGVCTVTEESPLPRLHSVCRCISKMALLTPCSEILWYSCFRSVLAHWMPGFYCLRRGQYFPLTIQSWRLQGKAFPWQRQNKIFCLTKRPGP